MSLSRYLCGKRPAKSCARGGKTLVFLAILLPIIFGIVGILLDAGTLHSSSRELQNMADSAALAAALEFRRSGDVESAKLSAIDIISDFDGSEYVNIAINIPASEGTFEGVADSVEAIISTQKKVRFAKWLGFGEFSKVSVRAVAHNRDTTSPIALIALDPNARSIAVPDSVPVTLPNLPISLSGTVLLGSIELIGIGDVRVDGAVVSNSNWGGVDENNESVGGGGPPYSITCTPLSQLNNLLAKDVRVVGGVDDPSRYQSYEPGGMMPLRANRFSVPDPLESISTPIVGVHEGASATLKGEVTIVSLPLITTTLNPGIYDSILVIAGRVHFNPGIYIIRNRHSLTGAALDLRAGIISAENVMFYIVDDPSFTANSNDTTLGDSHSPAVLDLIPSVVIATLPGSSFTPYQMENSEFDGMTVFQARQDKRPIVISSLFGNFSGTIYSKWGHVTMLGNGVHDLKIAAGTIRLSSVLSDLTIIPSQPFPAVKDTFLIE